MKKLEKKTMAERVAARFQGRTAAAMSPDKMKKVLEGLRKGTWGQMQSIGRIKEVLDHLGGWSVEPFVGLVRYPGFSDDATAGMISKIRDEIETVHALAKKLEVGSQPTNPKADKLYTMKVEDIQDRAGGFDFDFTLFIGAWGWKITSPEGKTLELLPNYSIYDRLYGWHNSNFVDLTKATKKLGKRTSKYIRLYDVPKFMKGTKFIDQVNEALGSEVHVPAKPRSRENTGSCPCCFRNIKLKTVGGQEHPKMVNHGYKRPGWGEQVGNCYGVGYPPFELSPEGTKYLRDDILKVRLKEEARYVSRLKSGEVTSLPIGHSGKSLSPDDPRWARHLEYSINNAERTVEAIKGDIKTLDGLLSSWKKQPLPEPGQETKVWKPVDAAATAVMAQRVAAQYLTGSV